MPYHVNSIAILDNVGTPIPAQTFYFIDMKGRPQFPQQTKERIIRPGIDGSYFRKMGVRGKPFQLTTVNYIPTFEDAANLMALYRSATDVDYGVKVTQHSVTFDTAVEVDSVDEEDLFAVYNVIGGFFGGEGACQILRWTMVAP